MQILRFAPNFQRRCAARIVLPRQSPAPYGAGLCFSRLFLGQGLGGGNRLLLRRDKVRSARNRPAGGHSSPAPLPLLSGANPLRWALRRGRLRRRFGRTIISFTRGGTLFRPRKFSASLRIFSAGAPLGLSSRGKALPHAGQGFVFLSYSSARALAAAIAFSWAAGGQSS